MSATKLSSKGQVIIPKPLRTAHNWEEGQELLVIDCGDGILLKPKRVFAKTTIQDVAGCLNFSGKTKTIEEMNEAIAQGLKEKFL